MFAQRKGGDSSEPNEPPHLPGYGPAPEEPFCDSHSARPAKSTLCNTFYGQLFHHFFLSN